MVNVTKNPGKVIHWENYLNENDQVIVRLSPETLKSSPAHIVGVMAHEANEILGLESAFEEAGESMTAGRVNSVIGRLHSEAVRRQATITGAYRRALDR